jgi:ACS family glucarate transporter-like MFS transporter
MNPRHWLLALLSSLSVITYLDRVCISVAGPRMQQELGISPEGWGWVVGVFAVAYGAFEIPSGYLGDRFGPRRVLARIVLWWSVFTSLTGLVSNYVLLLLVRFLFGAGEAGAYPNSSAVIWRWFPASKRASAFGAIWMASQLGAAMAPLLVVPLQMRFGWRTAFFVFGILGVFWSGVWLWWTKGIAARIPIVTGGRSNEISIGRQIQGPMPLRTILSSRNLWVLLIVALSYCYGMYFFISWLPTYLVKARGFSENDLLLSSLPFVLGAFSNGLGGIVSDHWVRQFGLKWGRRITGGTGLGVAALGVLAAVLTADKWLALAFFGVSYAGITFQQPTAWAVCLDIGRNRAGAVSGTMNTAAQAGSFLLAISYGYLVRSTQSYDLALTPVIVMLLVGAVSWIWFDPTKLIDSQEGMPSRRVFHES